MKIIQKEEKKEKWGEKWGIIVDGILVPGFESDDETWEYIKKNCLKLRNPIVVQLGRGCGHFQAERD